MSVLEPFRNLCESVRFNLDESDQETAPPAALLADLVARIRSSALCVTRRTVPTVHRAMERTAEALSLQVQPEGYVVNDPNPNAFAPVFSGQKRPVVVLHSGLVCLLEPGELDFILGHELGHLALCHAVKSHAQCPGSEFEALSSRSRNRYAEISADRVALVACGSMLTALKVMLKLASGLPSELLGMDAAEFASQMERDPEEISRQWELDLSHPSLPFRAWALTRFGRTGAYSKAAGRGSQGLTLEVVDGEIADRLGSMGDGRLSEMEDEVYRMALLWAGTAMVLDDDVIEPREEAVLARLLGPEHAGKALVFARDHGKGAVEEKLRQAVLRINAGGYAMRRRFSSAVEAFAMSLNLTMDETAAGQLIGLALRLR